MYELFFTEKEVRKLVDTFSQLHDKEFVQLILEQIFKKDMTNKEVGSNINI